MAALKDTEEKYPQTKAGRVYIIDFDRSRQLALGPGRQSPIELQSTQYKHPLQMTSFDPYSWDVYCMGMLFQRLMNVSLLSLVSGLALRLIVARVNATGLAIFSTVVLNEAMPMGNRQRTRVLGGLPLSSLCSESSCCAHYAQVVHVSVRGIWDGC